MTDSDHIYEIHANFCSVLANEKRLRILHLLGQGEQPVGDIATALGLTPSNVSQHLRIMRNLGVVKTDKRGAQVYYSITSPKFSEGYMLIREGLAEIHLSAKEILFPEDMRKAGLREVKKRPPGQSDSLRVQR